MIDYHINYMRIPKTLTVEESLLAEVERTKGEDSTSERVNELLARALDLERRDELERAAALLLLGHRAQAGRACVSEGYAAFDNEGLIRCQNLFPPTGSRGAERYAW